MTRVLLLTLQGRLTIPQVALSQGLGHLALQGCELTKFPGGHPASIRLFGLLAHYGYPLTGRLRFQWDRCSGLLLPLKGRFNRP